MVSQAIFFRDQPGSSRAIGRLVSPSLFCSHTLAETGDGLAVVAFSLDFEQWVPAWLQGARPAGSPGKPLYLPVDSAFREASHRIQVLGRTAAGLNFALPFSYSFAGAHVCQALEFHAQRREYVRRHQRIRTGAASAEEAEVAVPCGARPGRPAPPPALPHCPLLAARRAFAPGAAFAHGTAVTTRVARCAGAGVQKFSVVLDVADQPAWLKRLVLTFAVRVGGMDAAASPAQRPATPAGAPNLARREPAAAARAAPRADGPALADDWLPAALQPRRGEAPKRKQPKRTRRDAQGGSSSGGGPRGGGSMAEEGELAVSAAESSPAAARGGSAPREAGEAGGAWRGARSATQRGGGGAGGSWSGALAPGLLRGALAPPGVGRLGSGGPVHAARGAPSSAGVLAARPPLQLARKQHIRKGRTGAAQGMDDTTEGCRCEACSLTPSTLSSGACLGADTRRPAFQVVAPGGAAAAAAARAATPAPRTTAPAAAAMMSGAAAAAVAVAAAARAATTATARDGGSRLAVRVLCVPLWAMRIP